MASSNRQPPTARPSLSGAVGRLSGASQRPGVSAGGKVAPGRDDEPASPSSSKLPPRPTVPERIKKLTARLWKDTNDVGDFQAAVKVFEECRKDLFPWKNDPSDPFRGRVPRELRRKKDDRRVNVALGYNAVMKTVAMTVPEDHSAHWRAKRMVSSMDTMARRIGPPPYLKAFAETIEIVCDEYLREIGWQDTAEAWVQDATTFPAGILKVTFQRDFHNDPISDSRQNDKQSEIARLAMLREKFMRGEFTQDDAFFQEMSDLSTSIYESPDIDVIQAISVENLPFDGFRIGRVRSLESVYSAPWMSNDILMPREEVRAKFPFVPQADGSWKGIHPDDLAKASVYDNNGSAIQDNRSSRQKRVNPYVNNVSLKDQTDDDQVLVREVWSLKDRKVYVLVEGVEYAALTYTPKRQPGQWYPFVILVLNRVFGQVYGVSDMELIRDIQHRMNRKWTDDEKLREHAKPRGVYNTGGIDQGEALKLQDIPVGQFKGLNLGGLKIGDVLQNFAIPYDPTWCNTEQDDRNFQRMATQPPQLNGVTGQAKFAAEVDSGMQGLQISSSFRQSRVRRVLERFYTVVAEILLQELRPEEARASAGENAQWPAIYSDADAKKRIAALQEDARRKAGEELSAQVATIMQSGDQTGQDQVQQLFDQRVAQLMAVEAPKAYGFPEPLTREAIFRRLRCRVKIGLSTMAQKNERIQALLQIFQALGEAAQACIAAGTRFNPRPFLRTISTILDCEDELDEMFEADPNALVVALRDSLAEDPLALQPQSADMLVQIAGQVAILAAKAAQGMAPAPGPATPQGTPPAAGPGQNPAQPAAQPSTPPAAPQQAQPAGAGA